MYNDVTVTNVCVCVCVCVSVCVLLLRHRIEILEQQYIMQEIFSSILYLYYSICKIFLLLEREIVIINFFF